VLVGAELLASTFGADVCFGTWIFFSAGFVTTGVWFATTLISVAELFCDDGAKLKSNNAPTTT
jgi:hypothetical protein